MRNLIKSFFYAFRGIFFGLKYERNMRIHFVAMIYMYSFLLFFDFFKVSKTEFAIIFIANALVMAAELINTAIERTVDLAAKKHTEKGKIAKDTAAGAVLICAIFAVLVGIAIFWQPEAFKMMFSYFGENILRIALFIASLAVATVFIFKGFGKTSKQDNEEA